MYIVEHVNRFSYRHFRGNSQRHERRTSFNYDGIWAKYSRLWGRSFSEIGHYLPPNYFRTWYLNIRDTGTHTCVSCRTPTRTASTGCRNCATGRDAIPSAKYKAASGNGNSSKNISLPFYGYLWTYIWMLWNVSKITSITCKINIFQVQWDFSSKQKFKLEPFAHVLKYFTFHYEKTNMIRILHMTFWKLNTWFLFDEGKQKLFCSLYIVDAFSMIHMPIYSNLYYTFYYIKKSS